MNKINRIFLAFFIILSLVVIGELFYYFYNASLVTKKAKTALPQVPSLSPSENMTISGTFDLNKLKLLLLNKDVSSSILTNIYEGKIIVTYPKPGVISRPNIAYQKAIELQGSNGKSFWVYYTEENVSLITVVATTVKGEKSIAFDELKKGDTITIMEVYDVVKNATKEIKITKK